MRVLVGAHDDAVRAALSYLDEAAVMVRRGHAGETRRGGGGAGRGGLSASDEPRA